MAGTILEYGRPISWSCPGLPDLVATVLEYTSWHNHKLSILASFGQYIAILYLVGMVLKFG